MVAQFHTVDLSQYSFLVTGGAGFIGSHLVDYLLQHNAKKVTVLDNLSNGFQSNVDLFTSNPNYEFILGDICDLDTCKKAVKNVDYVLHEAALGSVPRSIENPIISNQANVSGFLNMLVAVKDEPSVKKIVYAASSSTYGDSPTLPKVEDKIGNPLSPYAVTKYVNELYADVFGRTYGLKSVGLRYFNVYGPRQNPNGAYAAVIPKFILKAIADEEITINGDGEHSRDFTFVENVIQANIRALFTELENDHEVFNVACGERTTLNQLTGIIASTLDKKLNITHGPNRKGDIKDSLADVTKGQKMLNYKDIIYFSEGIQRTINWYQHND